MYNVILNTTYLTTGGNCFQSPQPSPILWIGGAEEVGGPTFGSPNPLGGGGGVGGSPIFHTATLFFGKRLIFPDRKNRNPPSVSSLRHPAPGLWGRAEPCTCALVPQFPPRDWEMAESHENGAD